MKTFTLLLIGIISSSTWAQTLKEKTNSVSVDFSAKPAVVAVPVTKTERKNRALIMGVSNYKYEGPRLQSLENPIKDAQLLYDMLTTNYKFEPADVILLKDPTRQGIIDAMDKLSNEATENDNVLIFYAGHGVWNKQKELGYCNLAQHVGVILKSTCPKHWNRVAN